MLRASGARSLQAGSLTPLVRRCRTAPEWPSDKDTRARKQQRSRDIVTHPLEGLTMQAAIGRNSASTQANVRDAAGYCLLIT
jgi:hypothetical protein